MSPTTLDAWSTGQQLQKTPAMSHPRSASPPPSEARGVGFVLKNMGFPCAFSSFVGFSSFHMVGLSGYVVYNMFSLKQNLWIFLDLDGLDFWFEPAFSCVCFLQRCFESFQMALWMAYIEFEEWAPY